MIEWNQIDSRLAAIGKDRAWLAEQTPYSAGTIRTALAPNSDKRTDRMLLVLSRAIEDEEARQRPTGPREIRPGVFDLFDLTTPEGEAQFALVDRASRIVQAPTIVDFCRDVAIEAAERIMAAETPGLYHHIPAEPHLKVAGEEPESGNTP
jgi:hypothetical protein